MRARVRRWWTAIRRLYGQARVLWRLLPRLRWRLYERRRNEDLRGSRTPIQVCPRGCEYREEARREVLARTRLSGRAATQVGYSFETTNCPKCGAHLARRCARCRQDLVAPLADRCHFCGLPQPWASERRAGIERASLLRWREKDRRANAPADQLYTGEEHGGVWVIEGSVAQLDVDTVISDNDVDGQMWAQVARAIKIAAGEGVERLAQEGKPFKLGSAWWTSAGSLRQMRGIVHVASMNRNGQSELRIVGECLAEAFTVAEEHQCESIGIAAIGSGPASISLSKWSRTFADVAVEHLDELAHKRKAAQKRKAERKRDSKQEREAGDVDLSALAMVLVLFEPADFDSDRTLFERAFFYAWVKAGRPGTGKPTVRLGRLRLLELTARAEMSRRWPPLVKRFRVGDSHTVAPYPAVAPDGHNELENVADTNSRETEKVANGGRAQS